MTETPNDDNFAAAFEQLAELGDKPVPPEGVKPAEPPADDAGPPPQATIEAPLEGDEAPPLDDGDEPPASPKLSDDELLARFAQIVKQTEAAPQATDAPPAPPPPEPDIYSPEEKQILNEYEKDWPDVAKAEALRRKAEYRQLVNYVFQEISREINPVLTMVRSMSEQAHLDQLHQVAPDYDDLRDKVINWVGHQPAYLQPAYAHVIQYGTVDEVADLISRYRQATGQTQQTAPSPAPRRMETELPAATKKAAASLAPVSSKRSAAIRATDPTDFEGAFAEFAGKL
jgi:hypothetical protein